MTDQQLKMYRGNCRCADFIYQIQLEERQKALSCTCSFCVKSGAIWQLPLSDIDFVRGAMDMLASIAYGQREHKVSLKVYYLSCFLTGSSFARVAVL